MAISNLGAVTAVLSIARDPDGFHDIPEL